MVNGSTSKWRPVTSGGTGSTQRDLVRLERWVCANLPRLSKAKPKVLPRSPGLHHEQHEQQEAILEGSQRFENKYPKWQQISMQPLLTPQLKSCASSRTRITVPLNHGPRINYSQLQVDFYCVYNKNMFTSFCFLSCFVTKALMFQRSHLLKDTCHTGVQCYPNSWIANGITAVQPLQQRLQGTPLRKLFNHPEPSSF